VHFDGTARCVSDDVPDRRRHAPEHPRADQGPVLGRDGLPAAVHRGDAALPERGGARLCRRPRVSLVVECSYHSSHLISSDFWHTVSSVCRLSVCDVLCCGETVRPS